MKWSERSVIILGHGCRLSGVDVSPLLDLGVPVLTSWPAADLVDSSHENYYGRPGVYGQRCANKVLANADTIFAVGCRLSIWTVGYDFPKPNQQLYMVDCDGSEVTKFKGAKHIGNPIRAFVESVKGQRPNLSDWKRKANGWRDEHPWLEAGTHDHDGCINPHRFMAELQEYLAPDEVIVADCATGSLCAHQILKLKPPQRLMTSGGLGEMGCGLPGAIGAAFAHGKRVICLNTDGSMMLNLQELQTIRHHSLPVKIIVFTNDGYGMIKATQKNLGYVRAGVDERSGVSCPDFVHVARAFGIQATWLSEIRQIDFAILWLLEHEGPALLSVAIDPEYQFGPKLNPIRHADGRISSPSFDAMSPAL